jgi:hypothetical protein
MKSLPDHTDLLCKWLISLLIKEIRMAELSRLGWPIGFVKRALWTDSFTLDLASCVDGMTRIYTLSTQTADVYKRGTAVSVNENLLKTCTCRQLQFPR